MEDRNQILQRQLPILRRYLAQKRYRTADVDDMLQNVCQRFLEIPANRTIHHVEGYLYSMANQEIAFFLRRSQREGRWLTFDTERIGELNDAPVTPEQVLDKPYAQADAQLHLEAILTRFPEKYRHYRQVYELCCIQEISKEEAARTLGLKPQSLDSYIARAKAIVEKIAQDLHEEETA